MTTTPQAAAAAYVDALGPETLEKAAAYTTGNHWLLLWGLLVTAAWVWLLVRWGVLERLSSRLAARGPNLRAFLVSAACLALAAVLALP